MPFTPFHFGPGIFVKAAMPHKFSLRIFIFNQVMIDLESLLNILSGQYPVHRFLHTFLGSTVVAVFCVLIGVPFLNWVAKAAGRSSLFPVMSRPISYYPAGTAAFIGSYSHVILDSIMHRDMIPLHPFSPQNPLLGALDLTALHLLCVFTGLIGGVLYVAAYAKVDKI